MKSAIFRTLLCGLMLAATGGCASLKSVRHDGETVAPGIGYYLPNGDIRVTLTINAKEPARFVVDTLYYPDVGRRYSVRAPKNWVADTTISVKTNDAGLLDTTSYKYEPKIVAAADNLASGFRESSSKSAFAFLAADTDTDTDTDDCAPRDYIARFRVEPEMPEQTQEVCGYKIVVAAIASGRQPKKDYSGDGAHPSNGLYFRMNLPYSVEIFSADGKERIFSDIAFSPTGASTLFASTSRGLFSTMSGNLKFSNGVLVKFSPKHSSEIETAAKLPSSILKSYFDSVNALFVLRKGSADREADYAAAIENLNRAKASLENCEAAHASGDEGEIAANCHALQPDE